jgi:hypothetical protein
MSNHRAMWTVQGVHGATDMIGRHSGRLRIITRNVLDDAFINARRMPGFKFVGKAFLPFAVISGANDVLGELRDPRNGNWLGRGIAAAGSGVTHGVLYRYPPAAVANFLTGDALKADADAIFGMLGKGISTGVDRVASSPHVRRDLETGNYLGLGFHAATAYAGGFATGANQALNAWHDDVLAGKYTGFLKTFAEVEGKAIDKIWAGGEKVWEVGEKTVNAVSSGVRSVGGFVKKLF